MEEHEGDGANNKNRDEVYANAVRAGKRTYFLM